MIFSGTVDRCGHSVAWDGLDDSGQAVGSGVYVYSVDGLGVREASRVTVLR